MIIYLSKLNNFDELDLNKLIYPIKQTFSTDFNIIEIKIIHTLDEIEFAYNSQRQQYNASMLLYELKKYVKNEFEILIGITDKDLYDYSLNFIFGEAYINTAIVSINRFKTGEKKLLYERTIKTIIHELGHIFGLDHCKNTNCVMFFSNSLVDTDNKSRNICGQCYQRMKLF